MTDFYHPEVEVRRAKAGDDAWPLRWVGLMDEGSAFGPRVRFMTFTRRGLLRSVARNRRKERKAHETRETV